MGSPAPASDVSLSCRAAAAAEAATISGKAAKAAQAERDDLIHQLHVAGYRATEIGEVVDLSHVRIVQIVQEQKLVRRNKLLGLVKAR